MKPSRSILDKRFQYVPSVSTSVAETWRRFGWHPYRGLKRKPRAALRDLRRNLETA